MDKIMNNIEKIRRENNTNWMNLVRLAFKVAPEEAKEIMERINKCDKRISEQVSKLS